VGKLFVRSDPARSQRISLPETGRSCLSLSTLLTLMIITKCERELLSFFADFPISLLALPTSSTL